MPDLNKLHKDSLVAFWQRFGGKKNDGSRFNRAVKLAALIEWAAVVIPFRQQKALSVRRALFDQAKAVMHKMRTQRNRVCFVCGDPSEVRHHIISLKNGGLNCRKNLVSLCNPCHAAVHPWLRKAA